MAIFDQSISTMTDALNYSAQRNELISNNIANVDTPNYKGKDTSFKTSLDREMNQLEAKRTNARHLPFTAKKEPLPVHSKQGSMYNHNGNNVDIDKEMADLAKNQIYYQGMTDQLNHKLNTMKTAIKGGS